MRLLLIVAVFVAALDSHAWTRNSDGDIEFSVLSYNVKCLPFPKSCKKSKMRKIGEMLKERREQGTAPDVVMIQEGFVDDIEYLLKGSGYSNIVKGPNIGDKHPSEYDRAWKVVGSGLWILSDLPIVFTAKRAFKTNDCTSWDCQSRKGVQLANIYIDGVLMTFMNTHMNSGKGEKKEMMRGRQVDDIAIFKNEFHITKGPVVFGGDFNLKPERENFIPLQEKTETLNVGEWCLNSDNCQINPSTPEHLVLEGTVDHHLIGNTHLSRLFPIYLERNFTEKLNGKELSDHLGYEVKYRLITK